MNTEYDTISKISELLNKYGREYQIIPFNERSYKDYICDALIYKRKELIAVVEIKHQINKLIKIVEQQKRLLHYANKINAPYCILCNDIEGYYYKTSDYNIKEDIKTPLNLDTIIKHIIQEIRDIEKLFSPGNILSIFKQTKEELSLNNPQLDNFIDGLNAEYINNNISRLPNGGFSLSKEFERKFFSNMLTNREFKQLCRYTSLSSTIRIIKDKKASVCSIACMND